jgi:benzoyl-CoA reductase/2-hydroxyglutaryl-CoA dehydratase subunit BcrC/BadD/HgdB
MGGLDIVDLIIVPHACDSLQGLGSILLDFVKPAQPVFPFYIPRDTREADIGFFADELHTIYEHLANLTGLRPAHTKLSASIENEQEADDLLALLHQKNRHLPFSNFEIYQVIRSREYLPAEEFQEIAQKVLAQAQNVPRPGTPIVVAGIVPEPRNILETFTEFEAAVVADDLASCGRRLYPRSAREDPFERMAASIIKAPPDPTRGSSLVERRDHLLELVAKTQAKGVVFHIIKFCEPELFDVPILRQELRAAKVPSIMIEVDLNMYFSQQIRTRLAAFLEMIQ